MTAHHFARWFLVVLALTAPPAALADVSTAPVFAPPPPGFTAFHEAFDVSVSTAAFKRPVVSADQVTIGKGMKIWFPEGTYNIGALRIDMQAEIEFHNMISIQTDVLETRGAQRASDSVLPTPETLEVSYACILAGDVHLQVGRIELTGTGHSPFRPKPQISAPEMAGCWRGLLPAFQLYSRDFPELIGPAFERYVPYPRDAGQKGGLRAIEDRLAGPGRDPRRQTPTPRRPDPQAPPELRPVPPAGQP